MWYRGDLSVFIQQRPEQIGLPSAEQIPTLPQLAMPESRDLNKVIQQESREASVHEFIAQNKNANAQTLQDVEKTGDIKGWLASREVKQEKNEIDKLMNFLARGKYE